LTRLEISRGAQDDLLDIGRFVARDDPAAARRLVAKLKARARLASRNPRAGRVVPEVRRSDLREVLAGAYRILYLVRPRSILVLGFVEGHRLLRARDVDPDR
jgi:toxin ParE1/3/4